MKTRKFLTLLAVLALSFNLSALEVSRQELQSAANSETIVFLNYSGPHSKIDSLASIKGIGTSMGTVISEDISKKNIFGNEKYTVIHAVNPEIKEKLDADIIIVGKSATVDHINNLRHIIAAYLSSAYGYSESDAETLAVFITVYNAVYYKNLEAFQNKYKKDVLDNLSADKCGLSVNYKDWPGNSQIVIPLFDIKDGGLSTVDTSVISDSQVVKHMQDDDDKNIESRKDMVDLKEREAEQASEKAQESQKNAVQEQKKLNEEKEKTEEAKKEAYEAQKEADKAEKEAEADPENQEKQEEAAKKQEEADAKQEAYEEQIKSEEEQQEKTEEAKAEAAEQQSFADKKNSEAQEERKSIAKDQQEVIKQEIANAAAPSAFAIQLVDEQSLLSGLVKVNTKTGEVIKSSPVKFIRNRTMFQAGDNFIAIAGENSGNGAVKLVQLSPDTMEIIKESNETVSENSVLVQDNGEYYCIISENGNSYLAKYDGDLNLKLKSPVSAKPATPVTISGQNVIISGSDNRVYVLNKSDLKQISQ